LVLLLILVVALGIGLSPSTSIKNVRIEGAQASDQERLASIVKKLQDVPNIRIDPRGVESEALMRADVQSAQLTRGLFGSALLKVTYRRPVARLLGHPNVMLSDEGVLYKTDLVPEGLPQVQLPDNGPPTLATLAANWQPQKMAKLAQDALKLGISDVIRIQMDAGDVVCLNMSSGRVILGTLEDLDKKLAVLRERIASNPQELSQIKELNITAPENPSIVPKERN
jgi:cell division septal protein FtsQ